MSESTNTSYVGYTEIVPTPRTDACVAAVDDDNFVGAYVPAGFAAGLERELTSAHDSIAALQVALTAAREELERDAGRYQRIRAEVIAYNTRECVDGNVGNLDTWADATTAEQFDAAIDKALDAASAGGEG